MIGRLAILAGAAVVLGGCLHNGVGSVGGGECKIFERPQYVVLGKRPYDQDWIDSQVEGGVGGCGWQRPEARPAALDAAPGQKAAPPPPPAKKRGLIKRIKERVWKPKAEPIVELPAIITRGPLPEIAAPAPPPRDAVDELLQPSVPRRVQQ